VSDLPGNHARQEDTDADTDDDETVEADQNDHGYDHWRFAQHTQQLMLRHFTTHYQLAVIYQLHGTTATLVLGNAMPHRPLN